MSAQKRIRLKWLQPGQIPDPPANFREKVRNYPGARRAFAVVTKPGFNDELVWRALWELACRADERKLKATRWYLLPGLPLHTLRRFPKRVRGWAAEIQETSNKIQSDKAYGHPAHSLLLFLELQVGSKKMAEGGRLKRVLPQALIHHVLERRAELPKLAQLPDLLQFYADWIEAVCKLTAHYAPKAPGHYKEMTICALIDCVTRVKGKPHYEEIATLLTAAFSVHESGEIVDARNLRMQHIRHSHRK